MTATRAKTHDSFPAYSRGERILDSVVHATGVTLALVGIPLLLLFALRDAGWREELGLGLYSAGLLAMLSCSALYNVIGHPGAKELLRRFDHAAIFVMIAGTYSPFALIKLGGAWGFGLFAANWALAVAGVVLCFALPRRGERFRLALYLAMGWSIMIVLPSLLEAVSLTGLLLLLIGGLVYSLGVILHLARRLAYHNALWHLCVLAAAGCHYAAVVVETA